MAVRTDRGARSDQRQLRALQRLAASGGAHEHVWNEVPTGTINGSNAAFTLAFAPKPTSLLLFVNGLLMLAGGDFNLSGTTVTFVSGAIPETGDWVKASYVKA